LFFKVQWDWNTEERTEGERTQEERLKLARKDGKEIIPSNFINPFH
jgi:hypothetical protein